LKGLFEAINENMKCFEHVRAEHDSRRKRRNMKATASPIPAVQNVVGEKIEQMLLAQHNIASQKEYVITHKNDKYELSFSTYFVFPVVILQSSGKPTWAQTQDFDTK
jgi:hypothetical protein